MRMARIILWLAVGLAYSPCLTNAGTLPFSTVFKGREKFDRLVQLAREGNWKSVPIGERTATVGRAMAGTPYKSYTLEIDNRIESPSVNFYGMDCWTFFETALGFARMLNEPESNWTPERLLYYIEMDRYRGGQVPHPGFDRVELQHDLPERQRRVQSGCGDGLSK